MHTVFAVIYPSSYNTPGLASISNMFTELYHLKCPSINGYSLGHDAKFFDTLADAKDFLFPPESPEDWGILRGSENAIIELEVEDTKINAVPSIYEFLGYCGRAPLFACSLSVDVSIGALDSISKMLEERYVNPHSMDLKSTHPKAQLCRQLSATYDKVLGAPQAPIGTSTFVKEVLSGVSGGFFLMCAVVPFAIPEASVLESCLGATVLIGMAALMFKAGLHDQNQFEYKKAEKRNVIRHGLFAYKESADESEQSRVNPTFLP